MARRDVMAENLLFLTGEKRLENALKGWSVVRPIRLEDRRGQACELCGTRFRRGAMVRHAARRTNVAVGGTCLQALLKGRFSRGHRFVLGHRRTVGGLKRRYQALIDPGAWIEWTIDHAPRRWATAVEELRLYGQVSDDASFDALVRFHDRTRMYPRTALLGDTAFLEGVLRERVARYVTLNEARKLHGRASRALTRLSASEVAELYGRRVVGPSIRQYDGFDAFVRQLSRREHRALGALKVLDERASRRGTKLLPGRMTALWPLPGRLPTIAWNNPTGVGWADQGDGGNVDFAEVWLWRADESQKSRYAMQYWCGIKGVREEAVAAIEELAFTPAVIAALLGQAPCATPARGR